MSSFETEFQGLKPVGRAIKVLAKRENADVLGKTKKKLRLALRQEEISGADEQNDPIEYNQSSSDGE